MKTILALALIATAMQCAAQPQNALVQGTVQLLSEQEIQIEGVIGPTSSKLFSELLKPTVTTVVVTSEGGVTSEALTIAETIQLKRLKVIVRNYCISSCANYLFVAGHQRVVEPNSVVAWHGGHSNNPVRLSDKSELQVSARRELVRREQLLYLRAGVSLDLVIYSGYLTLGETTGSSNQVTAFGTTVTIPVAAREFTNWAPTPRILAAMGVADTDKLWHAGSASAVEQVLRAHGFTDQKVYVGAPYSHLPHFLRIDHAQ